MAARLDAVAGALAGYRESLDVARAAGWRPAARQVRAVVEQARGFAAPQGFFAAFAATARTSTGEPPAGDVPARLEAAAGRAADAYAGLADWLEAEVLAGASEHDGAGRDLYGVHARGFLGTVVDVDETYAWGLEELARIERRMADVARRLAPQAPAGERRRRRPRSDRDGHRGARPRPGPPGGRRRGLPRLDAGALGPGADGAGLDPLRHPRTGPDAALPDRAVGDGGGLLHTAVGGLLPAGADVVVGARGRGLVLDLARDLDRLPRGRARPSPAVRPGRLPQRPPQPLAPARLLGERARRGVGPVRGAPDGGARLPHRRRRPDGDARRARAAREPGRRRHRRPLRAGRARGGRRRGVGRREGVGLPAARTPGCPTPCCASSSTATSAGPARRSRTRSASGPGSTCANRPAPGRVQAFDLRDFHRRALDLGSVGLDVLRSAVLSLS